MFKLLAFCTIFVAMAAHGQDAKLAHQEGLESKVQAALLRMIDRRDAMKDEYIAVMHGEYLSVHPTMGISQTPRVYIKVRSKQREFMMRADYALNIRPIPEFDAGGFCYEIEVGDAVLQKGTKWYGKNASKPLILQEWIPKEDGLTASEWFEKENINAIDISPFDDLLAGNGSLFFFNAPSEGHLENLLSMQPKSVESQDDIIEVEQPWPQMSVSTLTYYDPDNEFLPNRFEAYHTHDRTMMK